MKIRYALGRLSGLMIAVFFALCICAQERSAQQTAPARALPRLIPNATAPTNQTGRISPATTVPVPAQGAGTLTREAQRRALTNLNAVAVPKKAAVAFPPKVNEMVVEARQARQRGDGLHAVAALDRATLIARDLRNTDAEAGVALEKAQTLERFGRGKGSPELKNDAVRSYARALEIGNPVQKTAARNNLGAFWLQEQNYSKAISTLSEINPETIPPAQRAAYRYNLGRALELNKEPSAAWPHYWQAWQADLTFNKPVEGCFRLALSMDPPRLAQLAQLATNLIGRGQAELAAGYMRAGLTNFPTHAEAPLLLEVLVRSYVATALTRQAFDLNERPLLLAVAARSAALKPLVNEIVLAFEGKLPAAFRESDIRGVFPAWARSANGRVVMSDLLKAIGDSYGQLANNTNDSSAAAEKALARYSCAWTLNLENTSAALYAAALLGSDRTLDPEGNKLRQFTETLFEMKGNSYRVPHKTEADWLNILRCHLVLASIYERAQVWGNEGNVTSAIFQLSRALSAEQKIRQLNPEFSPSPRLYARLANAYQQVQRQKEAWAMYLQAAEGFLYYADRAGASESVGQAKQLRSAVKVDPDDLARLQKVELALP